MSISGKLPRIIAGLAVLALAGPAAAEGASSSSHTLVLDARVTSARTRGPDAAHVGHVQIVRGVLRDARGHRVGEFAYTCRWVAILADGNPKERCSGEGRTADGRINFSGRTRATSEPHAFQALGATRVYRGARGSVLARDLGPKESLFTIELTGAQNAPHVGIVQRPAANQQFRARAGAICRRAAAALKRLPRFPFTNFDPTHPDPKLLPEVGRFFTGAGDPRPILRRLDRRLRALGEPPVQRPAWARYLAARRAESAARQEQDKAALAADVKKFVKSLHDIDIGNRRTAIAAAVFGVPDCTL